MVTKCLLMGCGMCVTREFKIFFFCIPCLLLGSCVSLDRLDKKVERTISEKSASFGSIATNTVTDAFRPSTNPLEKTKPLILDLATTLRLAELYSRSLQSQRERLYAGGLLTLAQRRKFGIQYSGTLSYVLNKSKNTASTSAGTLGLNASRILPTGGSLSASAGSVQRTTGSSGDTAGSTVYDNSASVEFRQPLLAGAGYAMSHESIIQAERNLIYSLRSFIQERQDFAIKTMSSYFNLLSAKRVVDNTRQSAEQSVFLRKRSEALFKVSLGTALDVMRARQGELAASNEVWSVEAGYESQVRRFLIELGLSPDTPVRVEGTIPEIKPVNTTNTTFFTRLGLERRLDLASKRDQLEDSKRKLAIARNNLLLNVDLYGKANLYSAGADSPTGGDFSDSSSAGISVKLPLDRRDERDELKLAMISVAEVQRGLDEYIDTLQVEIEENLRNLATQANNVLIQKEATRIADRKYEYSLLQFKAGQIPNRDVVEAQNELLSAKNAHVNALVAYELQRLKLLRNVGLLDVNTDGRLIEIQPDKP
jgi:outer membrane protein TolC